MSDDKKDQKPSIFTKIRDAGEAILDAQIFKAKTSIVMNQDLEDNFFYAKAITEDPSYAINASGWREKPHRLQNGHLKQMSLKDSIVAAVIQTRQNQIAAHSKLVDSEKDKGFMIKLRNEDELLDEIKEQLKKEMQTKQEEAIPADGQDDTPQPEESEDIQKAEGDGETDASDLESESEASGADPNKDQKEDDVVEEYNFELERKAREKLESEYKKAKKEVADWILNGGTLDNRPYETKKWNFDAILRAWVRDSLTYDLYATEVVPQKDGKPHHFFPVDGATIKFSSNQLKQYKEVAENFVNLDILYPEKKAESMDKQKVLELDQTLLTKDAYKFVQVIRGKIERAYTPDELKVGIRNQTTDIYNNGYGVSELELVVSLVTGHLNAEFYNQAYFTQGFSAKGLLHIKASINRRKLETVRQQWQHMLRGARNSFQTPIFAGVDDVNWIPLTQNHEDIGFEGWMRYLMRMICAIYQIDPAEIGVNLKDEGGGGGLSGDNTKEKLDQSKDKGLYPLLRHIENYVNENIIKMYDDRFMLCFTGTTTENQQEALERQEKEVKFKKTVNEVRAEDGLPPLPGMDDVILDPNYIAWYQLYSKKAEEQKEKDMQNQMDQMGAGMGEGSPFDDEESPYNDGNIENALMSPDEDVAKAAAAFLIKSKKFKRRKQRKKPLRIEYYDTGE